MLRNRAWVGGIALLLALHAPVYAANKGTIRFVGCGLFLFMSGFVMRSTFEGAMGALLILYKTVMD